MLQTNVDTAGKIAQKSSYSELKDNVDAYIYIYVKEKKKKKHNLLPESSLVTLGINWTVQRLGGQL